MECSQSRAVSERVERVSRKKHFGEYFHTLPQIFRPESGARNLPRDPTNGEADETVRRIMIAAIEGRHVNQSRAREEESHQAPPPGKHFQQAKRSRERYRHVAAWK